MHSRPQEVSVAVILDWKKLNLILILANTEKKLIWN